MGKSSIELTLKQLIALGIIKLKKRRRRKRVRAYQQISENPRTPMNETASSVVLGPKGYSTPFNLPTLQPNSDSLRLRDDNQNLNTRLLEYQQQLALTNQDAIDFQNKTKSALLHVFNSMAAPASIGYSEDDSEGAFGATEGSDAFKSMDTTQPFIEEIDTPTIPQPVEVENPPPKPGMFSGMFGNLKLGGRMVSTPSTADFQSPLFVRRYERASADPVSQLTFATPRQTSSKRVSIRTEDDDEEEGIKQAGGAQTPDQPVIPREVPSAEFDHVVKTSKKPTNAEITQWKAWYTKLAGDRADRVVLDSKKRTVLEPAVIDLLLKRYRKLGGTNKLVLNSKNAKEVARNVEQLEQLNSIF